ncbi:MAG: hypothetical protein HY716_13775 [Planctomycetes bacterium]|nr:hypothetical protein [Planctomycetota bacterium]
MRTLIGAILLLAGAALLYDAGLRAGLAARGPEGAVDYTLPARHVGERFPADALGLAGALWGLGLGLYLLLSPAGRPLATLFSINTLLALTGLLLAAAGASQPANARWVAIFAAVAALHLVTGLILLPLAASEKPRGIFGLLMGGAAYAASLGAVALVFLNGKT